MKKIFSLIMILFLLTGCGNSSARCEVEKYLKKYKNLNSEVLVDLERVIEKEDLNNEQTKKYRNILKKQYKDLGYEIVSEEYDGDICYVVVNISVYDLYTVQKDAYLYLENHHDEFNDENGEYDINKFVDYKLDKMQDATNRIEYKIVFTVKRENNEYVVEQPLENDLKKIHGIYNIEAN